MDLVFLTSNSTVQCVNVTIISDLTVEMNETFFVTLSNLPVQFENTVSTVTITDTDSMLIATSIECAYEFTYFSC